MIIINASRKTTILAAIAADGALSVLPNTTAAAPTIAAALNAAAVPAVSVWKTSVIKSDVLEMIDDGDANALTSDQKQLLSLYLQAEIVPCNRTRVRAVFLLRLFPNGGTNTRLAALFKRSATRLEAMFASGGDGSDANPHGLNANVDGTITPEQVEAIRS